MPEASCVLKGTGDMVPSEPDRCNPQPPEASVHEGEAQATMRVTGCGRWCRGGGVAYMRKRHLNREGERG